MCFKDLITTEDIFPLPWKSTDLMRAHVKLLKRIATRREGEKVLSALGSVRGGTQLWCQEKRESQRVANLSRRTFSSPAAGQVTTRL